MEKSNESAKVLQTKHLLASKLMELLEKKTLKKISVKDICQNALISKSAFYLHFEDKYQLLQYCLEEETERWEIAAKGKTAQEAILYILEAILEKKKFYYNIFNDIQNHEEIDIILSVFVRIFTTKLQEKEKKVDTLLGPISIVGAFYAGGIVSANIQWIRNDFNIPKEEIAECQQKLLANIF